MADRFLNIDLVLEVQEETQFNVYKFGYGDGYEQMRPSGINSKVRSFNIKTRPLESSDMNALRSILNDVCEGDFIVAELRPYLNNPHRFRIPDNQYTRQYLPNSQTHIFTFTLQEAFAGDVPAMPE